MKALRRGANFALTFVIAVSGYACDGNITKPGEVAPSEQNYWITGRVTEPIDLPLAGAKVTIGAGSPQERSTTTTPDGRYLIQDVRGPQTVVFSADGFKPVSKQIVVDVVDHRVDLNVEIEPVVAPADIAGEWTVSYEASAACAQTLPPTARARSYRATITQRGSTMTIQLAGATFVSNTSFPGSVRGDRVKVVFSDWDIGSPIEQISEHEFVALYGDISLSASASPITGVFDGDVITGDKSNGWANSATCSSPSHRVTFRR